MIAFSDIQAAAMRIAERFKPEKIILFGSYAYGTPNEHSDVDYMILMRGRGRNIEDIDLDVRKSITFGFPVDVLVRSKSVFEKRIAMGDFFLMDINEKGKVLYEAAHKGVGRKSGGGLRDSNARVTRSKSSKLR